MLHQTFFLAALFFASAFSLQLLSNDIRQGGKLPVAHTCDSAVQAKSPELHWIAAPADTSVFVLVLHNRDFLHWSVKLDKSTTSLTSGASKGLSKIATVYSDFVPPCPPSGVVGNYVFELFALAKDLEVPENLRTALHLLRHSEYTLATSQLSVYYGQYTKRAVLADTTVNLGTNVSIPVTTVSGTDTATFNAQVQTVTPPGAGKQLRVEVYFTATVTAGAGCFKAGLVGIQTPNTPNLPKFCSTGTGVVNGRFATSLPAAATSFQAWVVANTNPAVGTSVTFSGVVSSTNYAIPTELPVPAVYNVTADGLTVTAVYSVDDAVTSYANLNLPAPPTVPSGKVLTLTVSINLPATLCAMIGNGQIDDTKGTSVCDSTKAVTRTFTFPRGVAPLFVWVKFTKRTAKRGVLAAQNVPIIQTFAVIDDPTLANIPTTTTTSGCTDSWTLVNLKFGDMISR